MAAARTSRFEEEQGEAAASWRVEAVQDAQQRWGRRTSAVSHPIYKNINRAIIYAPGSSHAYIQ
jgi:hypothetical protein